jgi:hypothetical protein
MWNEVATKLARLKALDQERQVFGAQHHEYELFSRLSDEELAEIEQWLGVAFPKELRAFYQEVGDGIAGPYYGLNPSVRVEPYRPSELYIDAAAFRARVPQASETEEDYFTVDREELTGLIGIIDEGCGHEICLVTTGPRTGEVVMLSIEGHLHETNQTFLQFYTGWLDRELGKFEMVRELMDGESSLEEIDKEVMEKFGTYDAEDIIISIANAEKPEELFGTAHHRIYHGATQTPWYESVLREWREAKRESQA